jgi:hypothetical protein
VENEYVTDALLAVGQVCTAEGHIQKRDTLGRVAEIAWCPAVNYLRRQPVADVLVDHDDFWRIGTVVAYERSHRWGLLAAMTIGADHADTLAANDWYLSPRLKRDAPNPTRWERGEILQLSIVEKPGNVGTRPLRFGALDAAISPSCLPLDWNGAWNRGKDEASKATRYRWAPEFLEILDRDELSIPDLMATDEVAGRAALDAALARAGERRRAETERTYRRDAATAGAGRVRFHGDLLDPAMSRKVRAMLEDGVPVGHVSAYVRAMR